MSSIGLLATPVEVVGVLEGEMTREESLGYGGKGGFGGRGRSMGCTMLADLPVPALALESVEGYFGAVSATAGEARGLGAR